MPDPSSIAHPKVFVSYSHDHEDHQQRILGFVERLRTDGFETMIDQYVEGTPLQGWPRWMLNQIDWADYILLVCTETYYRRFRGLESPGVGKGVDWEGAIITNELYEQRSVSSRFVPVLWERADAGCIPEPLRSSTFYVLTNEDAYDKLTDFLAGAAGVQPARLGPPPARTRKTATPLRLGEGTHAKTEPSTKRQTHADLTGLPAPGGTMPADDKFYVERGADRSAKAAAKLRCETIVVKGPNQFGKSSLLAHYVALCRANGKAVASVDFSRFEKGIISEYGRFLSTLALQLTRRLRLPSPAGELKTQQAFLEFLESELLPALKGPVVFVFDETDRIMRHDYAQDFFSMVRMWHNDRADPVLEWHKVGLALASSSEPKLFIKDALRSPFNVGLQLQLESFTASDVTALNALYGSPLSDADCTKLYRLVGGHPFLTQDAYYKLCGPDSISFKRLCTKSAQDDGPFGEHLRAMLSNVDAVDGLLAALKQAVNHGTVPRSGDYYRLEGAGLVRRDNGRIVTTNQIYAIFFRGVV